MTNDSIDQLARRLAESVPSGIKSLSEDLERNFRAVLHSGLGKLDLVTREEFEVQQAVLARTREKLTALEQRLGALEVPAKKPAAKKPRKSAKKKTAQSKRAKKKT
jgi:BMFP domain-containing protein YqiC